MSKLSKSNEYAINWLLDQGMSPDSIASELKIEVKSVINHIEKHQPQKSKLNIKSSPVKAKDLMIRHTRDKKTNSVAIMTKEASEVGDESRKKILNDSSRKINKNIFRPNDN